MKKTKKKKTKKWRQNRVRIKREKNRLRNRARRNSYNVSKQQERSVLWRLAKGLGLVSDKED